jgi:predicted nucleic acid-binding protein
MAKVVIDANVIISAAFGGKPLEAVVRALEAHEVYLSQNIERELQGVISGLSKKLTKEQILFAYFYFNPGNFIKGCEG